MSTGAEILAGTEAADAYAETGGVRLHYVHAGEGPLVVLLHGFPEFWFSWRFQIPALVEAGYRVVAPDLRGYNLSDKPAAVRAYDVDLLAADVAGLIESLGAPRAHLVGHDWGAVVAYAVAANHPGAVERLAILNVPHPGRLVEELPSVRQLRMSWYMFFFQLPRLPERRLARDDFRFAREFFLGSATPGAFGEEEVDRYREAWSQPGALTGMVNYYRAALRLPPRAARRRLRPIAAPTLVIWGERDKYLRRELAEPDPRWVPEARVERLPAATHWVQHDDPDRVNGLLRDFLAGG